MPETGERKKVTERLCSRTGKSQGGENPGLQDCSVTPVTYRLDKSLLPLSFMDAMPSFPPTSSLVTAQEWGEWEKFSFCIMQTTGPSFKTWTCGHCTLAMDFWTSSHCKCGQREKKEKKKTS